MTTIIKATNLHKSYYIGDIEVPALNGINLTIKSGEIISIMGPSGCGKTTLLNCLSGLDDITSGEVLLEGENIHTLDDNKRTAHRAKNMGFVFQFYNLMPVLTTVENVEMPLLLLGENQKIARKKAIKMLNEVGLDGREHHKPAELSGGQRQRVAIARALVHKPAIIWADEPTGDLDDKTSKEIVDLFIKINKETGQTFVLITHDAEVGKRAHRLIKMHDGKVIQE